MPSLNHEGVIALVRDRPAFAASLLRELMHIEVPHFTEARLTEAALPQLVPVGYFADAVVLFADLVDNTNKPVFGTIFEVQLDTELRKKFTWPLYAVAARARYECPFVVTVVTVDPKNGDMGRRADRARRRECLSTACDRSGGHPPGDRS